MSKPSGKILIIIYFAITLPAIILFTVYCYYFLDRQLALNIYNATLFTRADIIPFTHFVRHITNCAYLGTLVLLGVFFLIRRKIGTHNKVYFFFKELFINLICSYCIVHFLKYLFGRTSIRTGSNYKLEVIAEYSRYGFHMFSNHSSFPSGHLTLITAVMITIVLFYPKFRTGCIGVITLSAALVLYLDLHYLSDITAGIYLGATIPVCVHILNKKGGSLIKY